MFGLEGIRILSLNHFLMGPLGVQYLADLGADVLCIEPIEGAFQRKWGGANKKVEGQTMLQLVGNRNKRSLAVNLKDPRGIALIKQLLATADVLAENFRPGVMDKLGLGYDAAKAIRPDIIYAAGSGFGPDGPYANRPGQDLILQALSGLAMITGGRADGPRAVGVSAVDHHGAALYAMGILTALFRRERTGDGCRIDVNLLSAAIGLQQESFTCYLNGDRPEDVRQPGRVSGWYFPAPYGIYATADGYLAISLGSLDVIYDILQVPHAERIAADKTFSEQEPISTLIARYLVKKTSSHWVAAFQEKDVWHSPVNDYADVAADPQVKHLGAFTTVPGAGGTPITLVSHPIRYDGQTPGVRLPPQPLGAQTASILGELGLSVNEIEELRAAGVVYYPVDPETSGAASAR